MNLNVSDFLKEKGDRLAKNRAEFMDVLQPQVREYFNEALNNARNVQWLNWVLDQTKLTAGSDIAVTDAATWPLQHNTYAKAAYKQINEQLNKINYIGEWHKVDQERINQFAAVTEDHQWIHTDPKRAAEESPFRTTIAHGFLTLSLIPKLIGVSDTSELPYPGAKMIVNMGLNQVRYPYPVKVGSNLRATRKVIGLAPVRRGIEVTEEITIEIEGCKRPACVAQTLMLLVF